MSQLQYEYIKRILGARVYDVSRETRLHPAPHISARIGNSVLLKREDEQPVFSFKCRGAFNRIFKLLERESVEGVMTASAGNHAQGVALAAKKLNIKSVIVMPVTTPAIKVESVRALGGEAVLYGDDFDAAAAHAKELSVRTGYPLIHPFDDPDTIAGQASVAVELCRQHPDRLDAVFVPVGGGGLAAGVSLYMKYLRPEVRVIGVEPVDAASMHDALRADERVTLDSVGLFADGVAVRQVGEYTFDICRECLDEIVLVSVDEMAAAIKDIFTDTRTLTEPAGALALAGLKKYVAAHHWLDKRLAAIVSGANINFDRLRHVAERVEVGESHEALIAVTVPEEPGSFRRFCSTIGKRAITEFNYRYADAHTAHVFAGVVLPDGNSDDARRELLEMLADNGYQVLDMTDNETAKLHFRHMVGGHAGLADERLFRFRFPERPGALLGFLEAIRPDWNITLFHYRSHGAAYGRVLVGMQVPETDEAALQDFLDNGGYHGEPETDNAAYELLLR